MNWNWTTEQLPPVGEFVLAMDSQHGLVVANYEGPYGTSWSVRDGLQLRCVRHWSPLPDVPMGTTELAAYPVQNPLLAALLFRIAKAVGCPEHWGGGMEEEALMQHIRGLVAEREVA